MKSSSYVLTLASLAAGLLVPAQGFAASLTKVTRSDWAGSVTLPSYLNMYVYVPDNVAAKPPIMISAHSCGSDAPGQMANIPKSKAAADKNGFILILPDNAPNQNCWDVGAANSLKHDGGGDTQGVTQMVKYAIMKYNADPARVYVQGGSGGAMLVQALLAVYPDVYRAGMARAGVAAGCWADGYDASQQWSNNCAAGNTTKTAQQWGDLVRAMYPGYTGHRPRLQTMQGTADTTINYKNTAEAIKEWTNVLGLTTEPTTTDKGYKAASASYDRQFWANACGYNVLEVWSSPGGTHSMPYEEDDMLKFFGLDKAGGADPEPDCNGMGGAPATGGMGGMGGMSTGGAPPAGGMGGTGGMSAGGAPPAGGMGGMMMTTAGSGGTVATGGAGTGGTAGTGVPASGGTSMMGTAGTGGAPSGNGGSMTGVAGSVSKGGGAGTNMGAAGTSAGGDSGEPEPAGCGCAVGDSKHRHAYSALLGLGLAAAALRRRQRRARS
ncbi:MAG TPA: PHB depolymerase family esterase [Polyangiaceae bacterium]|nr:PHB depolymerase family esterase [Polyangiaceae bacterium]